MNSTNTERIFAWGDLHGCFDEFRTMWKKLEKEAHFNPEKDRCVFIGDYIDRGPDSPKLISHLITLQKKYPHFVFLYGNHEDLFYDWYAKGNTEYPKNCWLYNGGQATLDQYKGSIPSDHVDFLLKKTDLAFESDNYYFVHGGLMPGHSFEESIKFPKTVIWVRDEFILSDYNWGKKVIFGHTADGKGKYYNPKNPWGKEQKFMPIVKNNKIGIDTAVCAESWKAKLTVIELPVEKFYYVDGTGLLKKIIKTQLI